MTTRFLLTAFLFFFMAAFGAEARSIQKIKNNFIDTPAYVVPPYGPDFSKKESPADTRSFSTIDGCDFLALITGRPDLESCRQFCPRICGFEYTKAEVRDFTQTGRKGIVCLSAHEMPELEYAHCDERHGSDYSWGKWCITYNKTLYGMDLQQDWQCAGLIRKNDPPPQQIYLRGGH